MHSHRSPVLRPGCANPPCCCCTTLQALWAQQWLEQHAHVGQFKPGWTYMMEAVYRSNAHVVQYNFEGLVLLAAVQPDGQELASSSAALPQLAQQLGLAMAAPCITGTWAELRPQLLAKGRPGSLLAKAGSPGIGEQDEQEAGGTANDRPWAVSGPPSCEGWVLTSADGRRHKLVQPAYMYGCLAGRWLHPLSVWDAVCCGGLSRQQLLAGLPRHFQRELTGILDALTEQYCSVQRELQVQLSAGGLLHWALDDEVQGLLARLQQPAVENRQQVERQVAGMLATAHATGGGNVSSGSGSGDATCAAGATSVSSAAAASSLHSSDAFHVALQYAMSHGTAAAGPMLLPRTHCHTTPTSAAPLLRSLILRCIRPSITGTLPGYSPSPAFQQTYAKGWARGQTAGRLAALLEPPPVLQLTDEAAMAFLRLLGGRDLGRALLVCRAWRELLAGDVAHGGRLEAARVQAEEEAREAEMRARASRRAFEFARFHYDEDDFYDGRWSHSGGGYGSF